MSDALPRILSEYQSSSGPRVVQVRGSLVVSSLAALRELGLYERYLRHLPPEVHEPLLYALASSWLPVDMALTHYAACEALGLDEKGLDAMGKHVGERITGTFLATLVRGARVVGANTRPTVVLQNYPRMWERLLMGGGCTVTQVGPKDVTIDSRGVPMFRYRYFRTGYAALIRGAAAVVGRVVYAKVVRANETAMMLGLSWV